jgi:hypothetical protein
MGVASPGLTTVPVAFLGRTSTLELQDPRASLRRQARVSGDALPHGFVITAHYWDIESGARDIEDQDPQPRRHLRHHHPRHPRRPHHRQPPHQPRPRFPIAFTPL